VGQEGVRQEGGEGVRRWRWACKMESRKRKSGRCCGEERTSAKRSTPKPSAEVCFGSEVGRVLLRECEGCCAPHHLATAPHFQLLTPQLSYLPRQWSALAPWNSSIWSILGKLVRFAVNFDRILTESGFWARNFGTLPAEGVTRHTTSLFRESPSPESPPRSFHGGRRSLLRE
jgi:hypothetical protein